MSRQQTLEPVVAGDVGESKLLQLTGVNTLADADVVKAYVWEPLATSAVELSGVVVDPDALTIEVDFGDDSGWLATVATPGTDYNFQVKLWFGIGAGPISWPNDGPATLPVVHRRNPTP